MWWYLTAFTSILNLSTRFWITLFRDVYPLLTNDAIVVGVQEVCLFLIRFHHKIYNFSVAWYRPTSS